MVKMGNSTVKMQYGWEYHEAEQSGYPTYYLTKQIHPKIVIIIRLVHRDTDDRYETNNIIVRRVIFKQPYTGNPLKVDISNIMDDIILDAMDNPHPDDVRKFLTASMKKYGKITNGGINKCPKKTPNQ